VSAGTFVPCTNDAQCLDCSHPMRDHWQFNWNCGTCGCKQWQCPGSHRAPVPEARP
jgi:hypothetical protein